MEEYEMLSQQEKDAIIARHHFIVDKLNQTLGNVLHYEDEAILRKLDDPKEVAVYRMFAESRVEVWPRESRFSSDEPHVQVLPPRRQRSREYRL